VRTCGRWCPRLFRPLSRVLCCCGASPGDNSLLSRRGTAGERLAGVPTAARPAAAMHAARVACGRRCRVAPSSVPAPADARLRPMTRVPVFCPCGCMQPLRSRVRPFVCLARVGASRAAVPMLTSGCAPVASLPPRQPSEALTKKWLAAAPLLPPPTHPLAILSQAHAQRRCSAGRRVGWRWGAAGGFL